MLKFKKIATIRGVNSAEPADHQGLTNIRMLLSGGENKHALDFILCYFNAGGILFFVS